MWSHLQQLVPLLVAQAEQGAPPGSGCAGANQTMFPFVIMMAILYFVWMRPASKERKQHQEMLDALKRGDQIVTTSGIIGTLADIKPKILTIEVARNVKINVLRSAVAKRFSEEEEAAEKKDAKDSKKSEDPKASSKS